MNPAPPVTTSFIGAPYEITPRRIDATANALSACHLVDPGCAPGRGKDSRCERSEVVASSSLSLAVATAVGLVDVPSAHAASWDPRIEPIARAVEKLRGLKFEHPVPVDFLSVAAFKKNIAVNPKKLSADDKEQIQRAQSQLRSIGLLPDDVDLIDATSSLRTSGVLALYDPATKRATVRGKKLDAATKVTLATSSHTRCRISTSI